MGHTLIPANSSQPTPFSAVFIIVFELANVSWDAANCRQLAVFLRYCN